MEAWFGAPTVESDRKGGRRLPGLTAVRFFPSGWRVMSEKAGAGTAATEAGKEPLAWPVRKSQGTSTAAAFWTPSAPASRCRAPTWPARQGLQRSTVSLIVDDLISERWVAEGDLGQLPRGRRPRLLHLNTDRAGIIGINIMPRHTTIALADLNARFLSVDTIPTVRDPDKFIDILSDYVHRMIRLHPDLAYEGIGVSVPGRVDYLAQRLVFAANLGWQLVDLKEPLESSTGIPVQIENAANSCALAEVWSGPHEGMSDLITVTVSDGIGTGIIANGHLVRGPSGAAGEFGHVCLDPEGPPVQVRWPRLLGGLRVEPSGCLELQRQQAGRLSPAGRPDRAGVFDELRRYPGAGGAGRSARR